MCVHILPKYMINVMNNYANKYDSFPIILRLPTCTRGNPNEEDEKLSCFYFRSSLVLFYISAAYSNISLGTNTDSCPEFYDCKGGITLVITDVQQIT